MSELKYQLMLNKDMSWVPCYLKSEADKFIADLEESNKMEVEQLLIEIAELKEKLNNSRNARKYWRNEYLIEYKECCRHKYKRCLANAEACMHKRWRTDEGFDYARSTRHMNKWLEIAEQFKPNNSTDQ